MTTPPDTTHFGFRTVPRWDKAREVAAVFHSVASRYDVMNDCLSLGLHRVWKRMALEWCQLRPHHQVLDLAGGTGDLARLIRLRLNNHGMVVLADINADMLAVGRDRLIDAPDAPCRQAVCLTDAEQLPFQKGCFDCVILGFGLRNMTDKSAALKECLRVLRPGGRLVVLEFSHFELEALQAAYDHYSFFWVPLLGRWIANDTESYRYLVESIRLHPDQETLAQMMVDAGFERVSHLSLTGGIAAIHRGYRL